VPPDPRRAAKNPLALSGEAISVGQWNSRRTLPGHNASMESLRTGSSGYPGLPTLSDLPPIVELRNVPSPTELHAAPHTLVELDAVKTQRCRMPYEMPAQIPTTLGIHRVAPTIQGTQHQLGAQSNAGDTNCPRGQISAKDEDDDLYAMPSSLSPPLASRKYFIPSNSFGSGSSSSQIVSSRDQTNPRNQNAASSSNLLPSAGQSSSSREQTSSGSVKAPMSGGFVPNEGALGVLRGFGISLIRAEKALYASGNSDPDAAVEWIFAHMEDPDIDQSPNYVSILDVSTSVPRIEGTDG
jgi:hypothetical protein